MITRDLSKGAKKIVEVCAGVRKGESVLIITDTGRPISIAESLANESRLKGGQVTLITMLPLGMPGEEPDKVVAGAMEQADVIFTPTTMTLGHSKSLAAALKKGARCLVMTECTEQTILSGAIEADFQGLKPVVAFVAQRFDDASDAYITAPEGTEIWLRVSGRRAAICDGICHSPGQMIGIPDLEVYIAPIENMTEGTLVVDASMTCIGLVKEPVTLIIEGGRVKTIKGGREADELQKLLENANDEASKIIAEFAIGLNPKATVRGNIIEDEGVYGTGHFALGNNIGFGGKNKAPVHLDMVYRKPTIDFDGQLVMKEGQLCGLPDELARILQK